MAKKALLLILIVCFVIGIGVFIVDKVFYDPYRDFGLIGHEA